MRSHSPTRFRRGSALPLAIVLALVLAALGTYLLVPIQRGGQVQQAAVARAAAERLATSACDVAVHQLRTSDEPAAGVIELAAPRGGATLNITAIEDIAGAWLIESVATVRLGVTPTTQRYYLAVQLGELHAGDLGAASPAPRPVLGYARGRTADVAQALR